MKKIMSLMLGLSLLSGAAVFAQDKTSTDTTKKTSKSTKGKKKKSTTASTTTGSKM